MNFIQLEPKCTKVYVELDFLCETGVVHKRHPSPLLLLGFYSNTNQVNSNDSVHQLMDLQRLEQICFLHLVDRTHQPCFFDEFSVYVYPDVVRFNYEIFRF